MKDIKGDQNRSSLMSLELLFQHKVNSVDDQESLHFEYAASSPTETILIWHVVWFIATLRIQKRLYKAKSPSHIWRFYESIHNLK